MLDKVQHLCIALDFSPDLMFFALFLNPTLSKCKQPFISYTNRHAFSSNLLVDLLPFLLFISFISAPLLCSSPRLPELFGLPKLSGHYIFLSAKAHELVGFISLSFILFLDKTEIY